MTVSNNSIHAFPAFSADVMEALEAASLTTLQTDTTA